MNAIWEGFKEGLSLKVAWGPIVCWWKDKHDYGRGYRMPWGWNKSCKRCGKVSPVKRRAKKGG